MERTQLEEQFVHAMEEVRETEVEDITRAAKEKALATARVVGEHLAPNELWGCEATYTLAIVVTRWLRRDPCNKASRAFMWVLGAYARAGVIGTINALLPCIPLMLATAMRQYFEHETRVDPVVVAFIRGISSGAPLV